MSYFMWCSATLQMQGSTSLQCQCGHAGNLSGVQATPHCCHQPGKMDKVLSHCVMQSVSPPVSSWKRCHCRWESVTVLLQWWQWPSHRQRLLCRASAWGGLQCSAVLGPCSVL